MRKVKHILVTSLLLNLGGYLSVAQSINIVNCSDPLPASGWERTRHVYYCPSKYPNYTMISIHRGLWVGDVPENSLPAVDKAIEYFNRSQNKAEFIELDIMQGSNGTIFCFHDFHLDRLTTGTGTVKENYTKVVKSYDEIKNFDLKKEGKVYQGVHIPTLRQALEKIKHTGLMVNIDKGDKFLEDVYDVFISMGMKDRVVSKGYFNNYRTPVALRNALKKHRDLILSSYTPIIFDNNNPTKAEIDAWISTPGFPGFEIIYKTDASSLLTQKIYDGKSLVEYVKSKGKRVGIFNEWPDNCQGTFNSPKRVYSNNLASDRDRRGEFEFLYKHGANFIVSDKADMLKEFLKIVGQRSIAN